MAPWTRDDIPDQSGRLVLVTGGNSGLGLETVIALAAKGARVLATTRSMERAGEAARRVAKEAPDGTVDFELLDLADLASVRAFAGRVIERGEGIDVLVNNAGVMALPERHTTADGFELQFGTNHLGHFALTALLLPALLARPGARVVTMTGGSHGSAKHRLRRPAEREEVQPVAGVHAVQAGERALHARARPPRRGGLARPVSVAAHPGLAKTNLQYAGPDARRQEHEDRRRTADARALPARGSGSAELAVRGDVTRRDERQPLPPDGFLHVRGYPTRGEIRKRALDEDVAKRLWDVSEQLTGVEFALDGASARERVGAAARVGCGGERPLLARRAQVERHRDRARLELPVRPHDHVVAARRRARGGRPRGCAPRR